jgi:sarcosine oxidase subunit beta
VTQTADVLVIGAGIMGASTAWHLAGRGADAIVLESESAPAMGSTGRSAAGVRVQFTTEANIRLSMYSLPFYRSFAERFGREIGYRDIGYLLLVPHGKWDRHLESVALQHSLGAPVDVLTPQEAQRYIPFSIDGLAGATHGPWDGVVDPHMVTHAWVDMGRAAGAAYRFDARVVSIARAGDCWRVVAGDATYEAPFLVNAAGAWSGTVGALAGLDVPVNPKRIQIFLSAPVADERTYPLTIDLATGVYVRSEGDRVLFGLDNHAQPLGFTEGVDPDWLEHVLLTGVDRFPWWDDLGVDLKGSWWGYYGVSPDNSPIIGPHPGADGWIDACGFSGHGIMHAPVTGLSVSEIILDGAARTVDMGPFGHDRFGRAVPVEANVF